MILGSCVRDSIIESVMELVIDFVVECCRISLGFIFWNYDAEYCYLEDCPGCKYSYPNNEGQSLFCYYHIPARISELYV